MVGSIIIASLSVTVPPLESVSYDTINSLQNISQANASGYDSLDPDSSSTTGSTTMGVKGWLARFSISGLFETHMGS